MPLDPKKLRTYMSSNEPRPGRPGPREPVVAPSVKTFLKPGQKPDDLLALLERGDEVDSAQLARLLSSKVGYMELDSDVFGYACGNCGFAGEGAQCRNPAVLAPVSAERGCCNLFWNEEQVVFPPAAKG
jgi:hypothetical protein